MTITTVNTNFSPLTLTDVTATLQGLKPLKRATPSKDGEAAPLKAELTLVLITDDFDLLKCFHDNLDAALGILHNPTIKKGLSFDCRKEHYDLTINEGLDIEDACLHGFKAAIVNVKTVGGPDIKQLRLTFKAVFTVTGRDIVVLSDFWKEKINLSLEPSPTF